MTTLTTAARRRCYQPLLAAVLLLASSPLLLAETAAPKPSCDDPPYRLLDFWVGEWRVVDEAGVHQGDNRIEKILNGCAILEHWTGNGGSEGKSLFYLDRAAGHWKQVWVTDNATRPGGLKEKHLIEKLEQGAVRFQGVIQRPDGSSYLDRTTLSPQPDGSVRQHIQTSADDGVTWRAGWVGIYRPQGQP
jgi:hypothetical protein